MSSPKKVKSRFVFDGDPAADGSSRELFSRMYETAAWTMGDKAGLGVTTSRSGFGSDLVQTEALRAELPRLVADLGVRSFLDAPCGDFFWMSRVDLGVDTYIGADIVPELVERNREAFAGPGREFRVLDLVADPLPEVDLVFSRDCFVHLSFADIRGALDNIKRSGSTYLAMTTFPGRDGNVDIATGSWRTLDFGLPPFDLPEPVRLINERCSEVYVVEEDGEQVELSFTDKSIGVWRVADL
ncbi:class I SAM-dependent methyltransferase [Saccharothrix obliqua]|uniref:class I SAM-dependent methyltransferase n=1 Tax=Saccharothrix obliqua TaxID=2861747 RepID=UPI001C5E6F20|nr:class I SAM-dependent methyltransferase [Saccharothrix obliqua]MBW4718625.1 class I SAM-dependent methyltransferase [Saccharothrix obliqua]